MQTSKLNNVIQAPEGLSSREELVPPPFSQHFGHSMLPEGAIADLIDGILILTDEKQLIYANDSARRVLHQLNQDKSHTHLVPQEIWHICQSLIHSRNLFPNQQWLMQSDIFTEDSTALHIRARWLTLEAVEHPCLLLTVEDRRQAMQNIAIEEAQKYGLTPREREVWLLHRNGYTYKQIALELYITPNTVKKHMKSIHAKQKTYGAIED
ncbi:MAG: helix-turn-helix transcriptional regulator [Cyanothece sp. SIO1E1]|nr:helix-turn-helix transcriptional regulator [Cyanothece sp. SIO1E1]